ncbi:hypothetical protein C0992_009811 [Termitomyces sp. T32_za158]|nr:hypothetical protein C0992_009811 [Termitomyces sp. T32_za158]
MRSVIQQIDITGFPSIDILQSQLFVLKVLSMTMASRLSQPRSNSRPSPDHQGTPDSLSPGGSTRFSEPQDLVALDEVCAKYVLSVVVMLLRHTYSSEVPLVLPGQFSDLTFRDLDSQVIISPQGENGSRDSQTSSSENVPVTTRPTDSPLRPQSSANSVRSGTLSLNSSIQIPATKTTYEKTHMMLVKNKTPVSDLIRQYLGRIIFQISASNWGVVYSRIRTKIQFLASNTAEHPDPIDLQLVAHCALDRARLVQILTELSSLLVSMGREGHIAIAVPLRAAVWNWITTFPHEFSEAICVRGGVGGAPERVFDILYTQNSGTDERIFWPTLAILNCTMSERMRTDFQDYQASLAGNSVKMTRKEQKFLDEVMRHAYGNSKLATVALVCLIDICRAATYLSEESESALRMIAHDMAHEIKAALTSRKPFWDSLEDIDVALYAEALVALYRFLPEEDAISFFSTCVEPERSEAVKLCAVRACLTLVQEANRCKWQRPLDKLQEMMSHRLRIIYSTSGLRRPEVDQYGNLKRPSARPKILWTSYQPLSDREVLLFGVIALWRTCPLFHVKTLTIPRIEEWLEAANKLWSTDLDISIKLSAANCIYEVACSFSDAPIELITEGLMAFMRMTLSPTLFSIILNLLHARQDLEAERLWMSIIHQLLELFTRKTVNPAMKETQLHPDRVSAFALAEIAFLVSLTSADSNVSALAAKGLRFLARAEHQPDAPINPTLSDDARSARNLTYEQLGDPTVVVIGRVGHQKRVRKCIRGISYSSAIYVAVWQECYWRWRKLTEVVFEVTENQENGESQPFPPTWEENRSQWQNLTLFLAALGGICVQESQDLTSLAVVIPAHSLPDEMRALQNPVPLVSAFMADLTSMLMAQDTQIRDIARDALGSELSAKLYQKLLRLLDEKIRSFEDSCGPGLNEASQLFLDQYIALLKLIVEKPFEETKDVTNIDVSSTAVTLCSFLASFTGPSSYRLKIKFCMMSESACIRSDTLGMQKNSSARRHILDIIIGWMQPMTSSAGAGSGYANLENELNMACLRTSVKLLDRLELRPVGVNAGDDSVHVVSRLFNKYSGALLQALETYQNDVLASDSMSELGSIHQKMRFSSKEADVRELVITGLAHLVSANTESGFKQCLPLAYDEDNRKRAIFAHVFARVIGQGTTFEPEDRSAFNDRNNRLRELVKGSDMALALTICEVCPPQEVGIMINVLLNIFDTRESLIKFMKIMIDRDLAGIGEGLLADTEQSIFRADTTCTRFFSSFAKIHGYNYLRTLVQPLIKIMVDDSSGCGYDLDPTRVTEEEARRNALHVELVASHFLEILSASMPALPPMFREICAHIMSTVIKTWPEAKYAATGAFMFLRFISPVLVSPELIDIELPKDFTPGMRRGLMVITKIIQNLANNIFFGKEAHMVVLNQFLKTNIATVTRFLGDIAKPISAAEDNDQWLGTTSDDTDIIVLHRFFDKHADKIGKELLSLSRTSSDPEASTINGKRAWDGLCALLVDHGAPLKVPVLSTLPHYQHPEYLALMSRYAGKDTRQVEMALENEQPQETFLDVNMKVIQLRPVILTVGTTHIRITSVKAQVISPGLSCKATEIIPLADISDIYNVATGMDTYEFIIRRSRGGVTEYFSSPSRDNIVKAVRSAKGRLKDMQTPLTERFSRFSNVPATLLHIGLLSVDMNDEELRGAAYDLLGAVCTYLNYDNSPIVASKAGFIPGDPTAFVVQLSEKIAAFAPQLTLDFIPEVGAAMNSMDKTAQRISCIQYMSPWIKNLTLFSNPTSKQYERSGARLRDCVRNLADLAVNYPDITSTIQKCIWCEVGKLDPVVVDVVLEELLRTATEGGIGTRRCEAITHAIASLSSIGVRGRIYHKLRKVCMLRNFFRTLLIPNQTVCKMFVAQPFNVLTDHPNWNEIATLTRFSLVVAPLSGQAGCDQLYVPEIIHNVTLTAGCGLSLVRKSVYGIIMNLLQALYISRTEESVGPGLLELINECATPARLRLFGLKRDTSTSEYTNWDTAGEKETLDILEELTQFLAKIMEVGSGSKGLLNVWRARWMSLITSTAFQVSPAVQTRAFIALGTLATSEVDDDFLYQILVAFNTALAKVTDSTVSVVSMLRCMCKVVPALPQDSRYICLLFWLAVALLQASHPGFYVEASCLLSVTLESIEQRGMFQSESVPSFLLKAREPLEETTSQLDGMIGMSFDSSFSFSLASIIFKGMRQQRLKEAAEAVLRTLLRVTVRVEVNDGVPNGFRDSISGNALGYFLALIPSYTKAKAYRELLMECKVDDAWLQDAGLNLEDEESGAPRISPAFLGINDSNTALLVTTFVGTMLCTAQGDDAETEILFALLSDIAVQFPQIVSLVYDTLQDRIKEILANASNPSIIRSVSTIFRLSVQDHSRQTTLHGSSSTLSTVDEVQGPGQKHLSALDDLSMQGLANNLTFLKGSHATTMINWIPGLVSLIIA